MAAEPTITAAGKVKREARDARLARALRENLTRRKEQSRARDGAPDALRGDAAPEKPPA